MNASAMSPSLCLVYAGEDEAEVLTLYDRLKTNGCRPWMEARDLLPGEIAATLVPNRIRDADVVLACFSSHSAKETGRLQKYLRMALSKLAETPPGQIRVIPVRLDDCELPDHTLEELGIRLQDIHYADAFESDGYAKLIKSLEQAGLAKEAPVSAPSISGSDDRLLQIIASFEALFTAAEMATLETNNPAARRIRDNLTDCLDDLRCCGKNFEVLATLPSHLAGLAQDIDEHLLGRHFEAMPTAEVLRQLEMLTKVTGDAGEHRVDTLDYEDLVAALKATIRQALVELPSAGLERNITQTADRELRHLRREVGMPSFDAAIVGERRKRLEDLKVDLLERTTLLTEALLAEGFPNLPTGTVFRHVSEIWCPQLVMIPAGAFLMGSPESEPRRVYEETQHEVTISKAFGLGRYPVTCSEYDHFCKKVGHEKPYADEWGRDCYPMVNVSHHDALAYCDWISKAAVRQYHLPSEAQWEYACRAGTTTAYAFGHEITKKEANFGEQTIGHPNIVGRYPANAWGLHDMHGNIFEWCADWLGEYPSTAVTDPEGPSKGVARVTRGGSWDCNKTGARSSRSAYRESNDPGGGGYGLGFRCACTQGS